MVIVRTLVVVFSLLSVEICCSVESKTNLDLILYKITTLTERVQKLEQKIEKNAFCYNNLLKLSSVNISSLKFEDHQQDYRILKSDLGEIRKKILQEICPVQHGNKCFFVVFDYPENIDYKAAERLCRERGANVGNIYSLHHLHDLGNYIRPFADKTTGKREYVEVFTAMKFDQTIGVATLFGGSESTLSNWYLGEPEYDPGKTRIGLHVSKSGTNDIDVAIINSFYYISHDGVLCELELTN